MNIRLIKKLLPVVALAFAVISCHKELVVDVTGVNLSATSRSLEEGEEFKLEATVSPKNATYNTVLWFSSDPTVASVDGEGLVKAIKEGTVLITAKSDQHNDIFATCTVTVEPSVIGTTSVEINKHDVNLCKFQQLFLSAEVSPEDATDKTVKWRSTDPDVAAVHENFGVVTANKIGTCKIIAEIAGGYTDTCTITVFCLPKSIDLNEHSHLMSVGDEFTLVPVVVIDSQPEENPKVEWIIEGDGSVLENLGNGTFRALKAGKARVVVSTAKIEGHDQLSSHCDFEVVMPVKDIVINKKELQKYVNDTDTLSVTFVPDNATNRSVRWGSMNPDVADVNADTGVFVAKSAGSTDIYAVCSDNDSVVFCHVDVYEHISSIEVWYKGKKLDNDEVIKSYPKMDLGPFEVKLYPENSPINREVEWKSSENSGFVFPNDGVVRVWDTSGIVTVTAKDGGVSTRFKIEIAKHVESVTLNTIEVSKFVDEGDFTLYATVSPDDAIDRNVRWEVIQEGDIVKKVTESLENSSITLKPNKPGTATVRAISIADSSKFEECIVTVKSRLDGIAIFMGSDDITDKELDFAFGDVKQLRASVYPENVYTQINWTSMNPDVADIDGGMLTVKDNSGSATIIATAAIDSACTASFKLNAYPKVESVEILNAPEQMYSDDEAYQLEYKIVPDGAKYTMGWSLEPSGIVEFENGKITPIAENCDTVSITLTVTGVNPNNIKKTTKTLVIKKRVSGIEIPESITIEKDGTAQLSAKVLPDGAEQGVEWHVAEGGDIYVKIEGSIIKGLAEGVTTITATSADNPDVTSNQCVVTVVKKTPKVESITLTPPSPSVKPGERGKITAVVKPDSALQTLNWTPSDSTAISIDQTGQFVVESTAKEGKVTITATATDGSKVSGSCELTITVPEPVKPVTSISISPSSEQTLEKNGTVELVASVLPVEATDKSVEWIALPEGQGVVELSETSKGVTVKAIANGTAEVIARSKSTPAVTSNPVKFTVSDPVKITELRLKYGDNYDCNKVDIAVGQTVVVEAIFIPDNATKKAVGWLVDMGQVQVTINPEPTRCTITGVNPGQINLMAGAEDGSGVVMTKKINVYEILPTSIILSQSKLALKEGGNPVRLSAKVEPLDASYSNVEWESLNGSVATVDPKTGMVYPVKAGTCTIRAAIVNGGKTYVYADCEVRVQSKTVPGGGSENFDFEDWNDLAVIKN